MSDGRKRAYRLWMGRSSHYGCCGERSQPRCRRVRSSVGWNVPSLCIYMAYLIGDACSLLERLENCYLPQVNRQLSCQRDILNICLSGHRSCRARIRLGESLGIDLAFCFPVPVGKIRGIVRYLHDRKHPRSTIFGKRQWFRG